MRKVMTDEEIFVSIISRKKEKLTAFTKAFGLMALVLMLLSNVESDLYVSISTSFVTLKIPKLYFVFSFCFVIMACFMEGVSYMIMNDYQATISTRILRQSNSAIRAVVYDAGSPWAFPLTLSYGFFQYKPYMRIVTTLSVIVICLPFAIVFILAYFYAMNFSLSYMQGYSFIPYGDAIAFVSVLLLIFPIAVLIFTFTPFEISKNLPFIRWLFLSRIYKSDGRWPQATYRWLKKEDLVQGS